MESILKAAAKNLNQRLAVVRVSFLPLACRANSDG